MKRHYLVSLAVTYMLGTSSLLIAEQHNNSHKAPNPSAHNPHNFYHHKPASAPKKNNFWWPELLDLSALRDHDSRSNPLGSSFDYAKEFAKVDLNALKADINHLLTDSKDWWPADYGNYGPFFIRMSWHSAGTYRSLDGRGGADGGQLRFEPLNSWPDNGNLEKARRLLWPIKKKYGNSVSWADLMVLAGTVALENMGFETYGFAGGRADDWEPDLVYWGPEVEMLASDREDTHGELLSPLAALHMGLIYVNPEGPKGRPDPIGSAKHIRTAFGRMGMDDVETVALVAGGHTFGKMHGAHKPKDCVAKDPASAPIEDQGIGWKNSCGKGHSEDTVTSGLEGAWTQNPIKWSTLYLSNLLNLDWKLTKSPAGAFQWIPTDKSLHLSVPDAHVSGKFHAPVMTTADLAIKEDPAYRKIAEGFLADPSAYQKAFARAWFKLTHRDMGPKSRYIGSQVPKENLIWQDPLPVRDYKIISEGDARELKAEILKSGLTVKELIRTSWSAAASFRKSDLRGGVNGARIALEPELSWKVNNRPEIEKVLEVLRKIQSDFNDSFLEFSKVSLADMIVLAGAAGIEKAAKDAGVEIEVKVIPGRTDASQEQTDVKSFALLEPAADAFRNYYDPEKAYRSPVEMLIDRADQLDLTVPEMVVLLGGLRVLGINYPDNNHGVLTDKSGVLTNDYFVNLLNTDLRWQKDPKEAIYRAHQSNSKSSYTATPVDLIVGANSELRAVAEVYAFDNSKEKFVHDFVAAWSKVMNLDRFDLN